MATAADVMKFAGTARRAGGKVVNVYKKIRSNRQARGKRVLMPAASYAPGGWSKRLTRKRRAKSARTIMSQELRVAPVATQTGQAIVQPEAGAIRRADAMTRDVNYYDPTHYAGSLVDMVCLAPGNWTDFPSGAAMSSQFQYAKFNALDLVYSPNVDSTVPGTVVLGLLANPERVSDIKDAQGVAGLQITKSFSVSQAQQLHFTASEFNTMFKQFPLTDLTKQDIDPMQTMQGYIVWTVTDSTLPEGVTTFQRKVGKFSWSYSIQPKTPTTTKDVNSYSLEMTHLWEDMDTLIADVHERYAVVFTYLLKDLSYSGTGTALDPYVWTLSLRENRGAMMEVEAQTGGIDHWTPVSVVAGANSSVVPFVTTDAPDVHKLYMMNAIGPNLQFSFVIQPSTATDAMVRFRWRIFNVHSSIRAEALPPLAPPASAVRLVRKK